jgi:hypothetical protein
VSAAGPSSLDGLERWMQDVLLHPDGVESGVRAAADRHGVAAETLEDVVPRGPTLSGAERLGVYSRMIRLRFLESMDEDFQGVRALVGPARFGRLCREYLTAHPSRSHRLGALGAAFPGWLANGASDVEHRALAVELATVERAILDVYEEADATPLEVDALLAIPEERWTDARFAVCPALRVFACSFPANRYLTDVFAGGTPEVPDPEPSFVCVHRTAWRVKRTDLTREEHAVLRALAAGETLGTALEAALALEGADAERLFASVGDTFREWAAMELFRAVEA